MEVSEKPSSRNGRRLLSSGKRRMKASDLAQDVNVFTTSWPFLKFFFQTYC